MDLCLHTPAANGSFPPAPSLPTACGALISPPNTVPPHFLLHIPAAGHAFHNLPSSWHPTDRSWPAVLSPEHIAVPDSHSPALLADLLQIRLSPLHVHIRLSLPLRSAQVSMLSFHPPTL